MNKLLEGLSVAGMWCAASWLPLLLNLPVSARDCNGNGSEDTVDLEGGSSRDCNSNDVPDECDLGPGNLLFSDPIEMTIEGHYGVLDVVVLADFTSDGIPDLVSFKPGHLLFFRGTGRGEFLEGVSMQMAFSVALSARAADTNGDTLQDVVAVVTSLNTGDGALMVLESKGDGTFEDPVLRLPGSDQPRALAVADLDGDGAMDILTTNGARSDVSLWWNDGGGGFPVSTYVAFVSSPSSVAAGDLDGDGDADIVATHFGLGEVSLLWNDGERRFTEPDGLWVGGLADSVMLVDFDGDGDFDIGAGSEGRDSVSVLLHRGGRVYSEPFTYGLGGSARRWLAADVDGDRSIDLAALRISVECNAQVSSISVLLNRGDGTFIQHKDRGIGFEPYAFALGDIDLDGLLDAVVTRVADGPRIIVSTVLGGRGPAAADADADGVPDSCVLDREDLNWNGVLDVSDIAEGRSRDCDADGLPDECEPDCDGNGTPDACDIAGGASDANSNGLLDACESEQPVDCNGNGRLDALDLLGGTSRDCDANHVPDECEIAQAFQFRSGDAVKIGLSAPAGGVATADLDADGDLDIAIAMRGSCCAPQSRGSVALFENLGAGKFVPAGSHAADGDATLVIAVDVDGDADPDLLVANRELACRGPARAALLLNDGRGAFRRGEGFVLKSDPAAVVGGDFDGDGDLDLAFANDDRFAAAISIFLNDGSGAFAFTRSAGTLGGASSVTAGDWNGDGLMDIAAAATGTLDVLTNRGGAVFISSELREGTDTISSVAAADMDRDGDLDLVTGLFGTPLSSPPGFQVFRNDAGAFSALQIFSMESHPRWLVPGDWDGDGFTDVVAAGISVSLVTTGVPGGVSILLNNGDGSLRAAGFFTVDSAPPAGAAGDLNGDGTLDLLLTDEIFKAAAIFFNEGGGRLATPLQYLVGPGPKVILALDANGDADPDLAVLNGFADRPAVTLLTNAGKGSGFAVTTFTGSLPAAPRAMAAGDLDGDSDPDLAVAGEFAIAILKSQDGALARGPSLRVGSNPFSVVVFDADRDGDSDLATANILGIEFRDNVTVFRNNGSGSFGAGRNFAVGMAPRSLIASDLDGDGFDELISANGSSLNLTVLRNLTDGSFATSAEISTVSTAHQLRQGDADGDADRDLFFSTLDQVYLVNNLGSEAFLRPAPTGAGFHFTFEPADLDGDGDTDLVLATHGQIHVLGNNGDGTFFGPTVLEIGALINIPVSAAAGGGASGDPFGASSIAPSDLDGDGDVDLALSLVIYSRVIILSNVSRRAKPDLNRNSIPDECETPSTTVFRRGDAKEDGAVNLTDAVFILRHLFVTGDPLPCRKAADSNDDARVDVSDAIAILRFLFLGHGAPPEPFPACGQDPTPDLLECAATTRCP